MLFYYQRIHKAAPRGKNSGHKLMENCGPNFLTLSANSLIAHFAVV